MIVEICGGEVSDLEVAGKEPDDQWVIDFDPARVEKLTGLKLKTAEITGPLKKLGFDVKGSGAKLSVMTPSWRPDIHGAHRSHRGGDPHCRRRSRAGDTDDARAGRRPSR